MKAPRAQRTLLARLRMNYILEKPIGETDGLIDRKVEVAETVARKLTEDTHKDHHG